MRKSSNPIPELPSGQHPRSTPDRPLKNSPGDYLAPDTRNSQTSSLGKIAVPGQKVEPRGFLIGLSAYIIWGFFPLYFVLLKQAGALEVIAHRTWWGLFFCLLWLGLTRTWSQLSTLVRQPKVVARLALAALALTANWTVYVYAVLTNRTVDAALGYFINPLITVALAVIVLRERVSRLQIIALGLGSVSVIVLVVGLGRLPWISLVLPLCFALYALIKKDVAAQVPPVAGMAVETATLTPLLLGYLGWLTWMGQASFQHFPGGAGPALLHLTLLIGSGALTMIPLVMFARASAGIPLGVMGLLQYLSPVVQLFIGVAVFKEHMSLTRWIGTAIVWLALLFLSWDMWRKLRPLHQRR